MSQQNCRHKTHNSNSSNFDFPWRQCPGAGFKHLRNL
ncbi:hypothetical protein BVRB_7g174330 [Beta vulgaris subsp. vulgaris]|nr:hypothetical protein BVRB_7g174330 [Beta vulgaris subsp. vulgaris]